MTASARARARALDASSAFPARAPRRPSPLSAAARPGGIYLLAGGQLHEAADKSRIPDPVQFYIYRHDGAWCSRRSTVTRSRRLSSSNSSPPPRRHPLGSPPRAIPSSSRLLSAEVAVKRSKGGESDGETARKGCLPRTGEGEGGGQGTTAAVVLARLCESEREARGGVCVCYACCVLCMCAHAAGGREGGRAAVYTCT